MINTIGLTGGIGSGKSTVAGMLRALGAHVVDTDALAHGLTAPGGAALPAIAARFGGGVIGADGAMDRAQMRALVFNDPAAKLALEAILHPMIQAATQAAAAAVPTGAVVVFDVPLLAEAGERWRSRVDRVLVVDCSRATQIDRVVQRNGWSREMVERIIDQQASREQRRAVADAVIDNDAVSLDALRQAVTEVWTRWTAPPPGAPTGV
ncbi:MAG: dephospho-CoA kinase [Burkholderiales bacterium]